MTILEGMQQENARREAWHNRREVRVRLLALPEDYRRAASAFERYVAFAAFASTGLERRTVAERIVDVFETAAGEGAPLIRLLGSDAAPFADAIAVDLAPSRRLLRERRRLSVALAGLTGHAQTAPPANAQALIELAPTHLRQPVR